MIFNIRGPNGCGKSSVVFKLIAEEKKDAQIKELAIATPNKGNPQSVRGIYLPHSEICIIGRYHNKCGGCDGIKTQDGICDAVREAAKRYAHVVFEGVIVSTLYTRYANLCREMEAAGHPYTWLYITTPFETCRERTLARSGKTEINEKLFRGKCTSSISTKRRAIADGFTVVEMPNASAAKKYILGYIETNKLG